MEPQRTDDSVEITTEDIKIMKIQNQKGILSEEFLEPYKTKIPPFGPLGFVTYKRTYARLIEKENRTEEWWETCRREIEGIYSLGCELTKIEAQQVVDDIFNLRCSFSGRAKWQLGSKTVKKLGGSSLNACWGIVVDNWMSFVFAFDMLMLGGGVGFNIQREFVYQLPKIQRNVKIERQETNDADFIVPDSREGWCELLSRVLRAWFETGKGFSYSTVCIRGKGEPIKGFGGVASGPRDLCEGIADICSIFKERQGKKLRPIDCLDIMNIIGRVVVSGNVRRSALLALGDQDDYQFLQAKRWDLGNIPNWRKHSNNSIACNDINTLQDSFWDSFSKDPRTGMAKGEPYGLVNLKLGRERGRALDTHRTDPDITIHNPCSEITLAPPQNTGQGEACNLIEIYLPKISSMEEFVRIAKLCYRVVKTVAAQPYHWEEAEKTIHKNMRLGISVTGVCDWLPKINQETAAKWLDTCYAELEKEDERYSACTGLNKSIKLTTLKPSGCRPWNALTTTDKGILTLEELFVGHREGQEWGEMNVPIYAINQNGEQNKITKTYANGKSQVLNVRLSYNYVFTCTPNHKWFVTRNHKHNYSVPVNKWIEAQNLSLGDVIELNTKAYRGTQIYEFSDFKPLSIKMRGDAQEITTPKFMTEDVAWLFGYFWGDGAQSPGKYRIRFTDEHEAIIRKADRILKEVFSVSGEISKPGRNDYCLDIASKALWHWFIRNDLFKYFANSIDLIPECVRRSSWNHVVSFLSGCLDSDGWAGRTKNDHGDKKSLVFTTADDRFADHLQHIAWSLGLCVGRSLNSEGDNWQKEKHMWHLSLSVYAEKDAFDVLCKNSVKCQKANLLNPGLEWNCETGNRGLVSGKVVGVEDGGEMDTYDIEVDNSHWYYAGAAKSHNTLSILPQVSPGVHPNYSPYYIRRIRFASSDPLVEELRSRGYSVEPVREFDGSLNPETMVVSFPIKISDGAICAKDMTAVEQLELVKFMSTHWADNAVSVTVYFKEEELPEIKAWLKENYNQYIKAVSFLLHSDHGFAQAPYEEISEQQYLEMSSHVKPLMSLNHSDAGSSFDAQSLECANGVCPVK